VNPGAFDTKLQIQRLNAAAGVDALGQANETWELYRSPWARRMKQSGSESTSNAKEVGKVQVTFRVRYISDLTLKDRVVESGLTYDIVNIVPVGRRHLQDLECVLHSDVATEGSGLQ